MNSGNGTLDAGTGSGSTVEYNGAGAQTIGDFTYENLTLSGANTKTLAGNTIATKRLTTSVTLNMDDNDLTVGSLTGSGNITNQT